MKKLFITILCFGILTSCEDVIDVELNDAPPKLVIDASISKGFNDDSVARVFLSTTIPFFDNGVTKVNDAEVTISSSNGTVYELENTSDGLFGNNNFNPDPNLYYTLRIVYKDEIYTATEQLNRVVPLEFVEQRNDGGFTGEDIELKAYFTDPAGEKNYYFFEGLSEKGDVLNVYDDEFFNGNTLFGYYVVEDLEAGDEVYFYLHGADEAFYNFMFILLQQTSNQGGGPFETQPATVRGNIINETNPDNFPMGYFRISEVSILNYTVE